MMKISHLVLLSASVHGALAVALGAFGAHGLRARLSPDMLSVYRTGVDYHFYHTLSLLGLAAVLYSLQQATITQVTALPRISLPTTSPQVINTRMLVYAALFFNVGIILFSGSLYALALGGPMWLGPITPLGGLSFIVAWLLLFCFAWQQIRK